MKLGKKTLRRWLLAAGLGGALIGGIASALPPEDCYKLYPCGCAEYGGYIYCTDKIACGD